MLMLISRFLLTPSENTELPLDLTQKACKESSKCVNWGCENIIQPNKVKDWATKMKYKGAIGSWIEVQLAEQRMYDISRVTLLNRQYNDYRKASCILK